MLLRMASRVVLGYKILLAYKTYLKETDREKVLTYMFFNCWPKGESWDNTIKETVRTWIFATYNLTTVRIISLTIGIR